MIKTVKKVIVLTAMMVMGATLVFAQAESNTSKATFGQFFTDVDYFFHVNYWKDLEFNGFFGYSRFGANIPAGVVDAGAAFKAGPLFVGLYYNGNVLGYSDPTAYSYKFDLQGPNDKTESFTQNVNNKKNPNATYGAMIGVKNLAFKFTFKDDLKVTSTESTPGSEDYDVPPTTWDGTLTPKLEIGLPGVFRRITLEVPIVYDRKEDVNVNRGIPGFGGGSAVFDTITQYIDPTTGTKADAIDQDGLLLADGNYVQTDIGLGFKFPVASMTMYLDNNIRFNIYGVPGKGLDGKDKTYFGVASVITNYDPFGDPVNGNRSEYGVLYDNRFWLEDVIYPSIDLVDGTTGKFSYLVNFELPISFRFTNHAMNFKREAKYDLGVGGILGKSYEIKDFYKRFDFDMGITSALNAGVQFKPADILSLQAGVGLGILSWNMNSWTETKVKPPAFGSGSRAEEMYNDAVKQLNSIGGQGISYSGNESITEFNFTYPGFEFALGFTINIKQTAALDFVYLNRFNPSVAGLVYKAVGEGLGSGDTSIVLSLKF